MRRTSLATYWYELGAELLPNNINDLDVIQTNHSKDVNICCREMFRTWLIREPYASWGKLVRALNEIELNSAANFVSTQYISGTYKRK